MSGRTRLGMGLTQQGSDEGGSTGRTSQQIEKYHKRKRSTIYRKTPRGKIIKIGMLSGGQAKLDKNKNNRIDAQDFKILRAEKAKGRGKGLQDEKMKPGKPMKAALGAIALGLGAKKMLDKKKDSMKDFAGMTGIGASAKIMKKKKEILGRMGGGMMMRTPGYKKGKSVMAKGCKLGRKKPTKMY